VQNCGASATEVGSLLLLLLLPLQLPLWDNLTLSAEKDDRFRLYRIARVASMSKLDDVAKWSGGGATGAL